MGSLEARVECLKLAVQVATAEAVEKARRAPDTERVAELTGKFYDLVSTVEGPEETASAATPKGPQPAQGTKKPKADKDKIFD
jgi:hypothetical protein